MPLERFYKVYGREGPVFVSRGPGRVNLIGEHTDYNGGYVMPMAIDRSIRIAFRPTCGSTVDVTSVDYAGRETFDLLALEKRPDCSWINYPQGIAHVLREAGYEISGFEAVVAGDVPTGAGLSSSAAFEVALILAFRQVGGLSIDRAEMARLCQRAEHTFAGVNCGIMDMYVSLFAERDRAVFIDCTTITHELEPLDSSRASVVVSDTGVKHQLAQSEYNTRRAECESAFAKLKDRLPNVATYKDICVEDFEANADVLAGNELKRATHVVYENQRVLDSVRALRAGDLEAFGKLMNASHDSLREDFQVSCAELDLLVSLARGADGVYGSRMTGGGFGGCTVSLARPDAVDAFTDRVSKGYEAEIDREPRIYVFEPAEGAGVTEV